MILLVKCKMCYKEYKKDTDIFNRKYDTCSKKCQLKYAKVTGSGFTNGVSQVDIIKRSGFNISCKILVGNYHRKNRDEING